MTITTVTSREFNQDVSKIKRASLSGPVFITDRGQPAHVLLAINDYQRLTKTKESIVELLAMPDADKNVTKWASNVPVSSLFLSVITVLELETDILLVDRRDSSQGAVLRSWLNTHVLPAFSERILPLDIAVAQRCAKLHVPDPRSDRDAIISATALVHGMTVVTRNICDFDKTGVEILNPWESSVDS